MAYTDPNARPALQPGDLILNGKYRVVDFLGQGAFAQVYRAHHLELKVDRAVKVVSQDTPGVGSSVLDDYRARFRQEAQLGAKLDHPHVIRIYDFEEAEGRLYLVMEYAPGGSLARLVGERGPLPVEEAVRLTLEAAAGLEALHQLGTVHRDVKPSNILLDGQNHAKLADLGLAQLPGGPSRRSMAGSLAPSHPGTPEYMSPEQETTSGFLTASSDVYSLGCVLFELLTGRLWKQAMAKVEDVRELRPEVPEGVAAVLARMLREQAGRKRADADDRTKRYVTMEGVHRALKDALPPAEAPAGVPPPRPQPRPREPSIAPIPRPVEKPTAAARPATRPPAAGARWLAVLLAAVIVLAAGVWYLAPRLGSGERSSPAGSPPALSVPTPTATAATLTYTPNPTYSGQPAAEMPSATPTATAPPGEPMTYLVQPGDTLNTVAQRFNVSLDDLMRANAITNEDYLLLGQKLVIPVGGLPIVTPTFTAGPPPSATPLPVEPPTPLPPGTSPGPVPVSDIQLTLEVLNPGDPAKEMVYIVNHGLYVRLTGWILSDGRGDMYTFPAFGLGGSGAGISVHTGSGVNTPADLYWGRQGTVWKKGDVAVLKDSSGTVVAAVTLTYTPNPTYSWQPTAELPTATPTATAAPGEPMTYIVQPGDTFSTIAQRFNVSLDDLMLANGITNPDYLLLGQKLIIPVGGLPVVTPTFTLGPVPAASLALESPPVPTLTPVPASDIQLTLEVLNPGDPVREVVYIVNHGLYVRLTGWILSDGRGDVYTFPDFGLGGGGAGISVHTGNGANTPADLYWGRTGTVWKKGDVAVLKDSTGTVVTTFNVK